MGRRPTAVPGALTPSPKTRSGRKSKNKNLRWDSFFKILLGDFAQKLRIPDAFIKRFIRKVPFECILKANTHRVWHVSVGKVEDGLYFLNGWPNYVKENLLEIGEILVFTYDGNSRFDVRVFSRSGCEKVSKYKEEHGCKEVKLQSKELVLFNSMFECRCTFVNQQMQLQSGGCPFKIQNLHYTRTLKKSMTYSAGVPKGFADATCLRSHAAISLQDPNEKMWPVKVYAMKNGRTYFGSQWSALLNENEISTGDVFAVEYIPGTLRQACGIFKFHIFKR